MALATPMWSLALLLATLASPVWAMTEEEQQRCVWSCLASYGPNTNPAYHACVKAKCVPGSSSTGQAAKAPSVAVFSGWSSGRSHDGSAYYAGLGDADDTYGFYYFCDRQGRSEIMLVGLQGPGATMSLSVDGVEFRHIFEQGSGGHLTALPSDDPLISALSRGSIVEVRNPSNATVLRYGLRGSSKALASTIARCR